VTTIIELRALLARRGRYSERFNKSHGKDGRFAAGSGVAGAGGGGPISLNDKPFTLSDPPMTVMGAGRTPQDADKAPPMSAKDAARAVEVLNEKGDSPGFLHVRNEDAGALAEAAMKTAKERNLTGGTFNMSRVRPVGNETQWEGVGLPRGEGTVDGKPWKGMPQIEDVDGYTADLRGRGIKVTETSMDVTKLKAVQSQLDLAKAGGIGKAGNHRVPRPDGTPGVRVLVSRDGYIIDGHHRAAAAWTAGEPLSVSIVDMDMMPTLLDAQSYKGAGPAKAF
jgi:hypothetical protein